MSEFDDEKTITIDFEQIEQVAKVFFEESAEILQGLDALILALEEHPTDVETLNKLFRQVHTLKGSVGPVPGGQLFGSLAHEFEALLSKLKKEQAPANRGCIDLFLHSSKLLKILAESLRDKSEILPEVLSEAIELITRYGQFEVSGSSESATHSAPRPVAVAKAVQHNDDGIWISQTQLEEILKISNEVLVLKNHFQFMVQTNDFKSRQADFNQQLHRISDRLQGQMSQVLQMEAKECFKGLPTLVRQAATELNKEVSFSALGMDVWIDKNMGRDINEAMMHLVRNSLDHGIEDPFDRATAGKESVGQLSFEVSEKSGCVLVRFSDDGRGLDRERILAKAIEKALVATEVARNLRDEEVFQFIFHPGFSTKEKITTISGRGVGMDVVHQIIQKYHGQIRIESKPTLGTSFLMEFMTPQHLSMESTILCGWQDLQMALPVSNVAHIQSFAGLHLTSVGSMRFAQWNGQTVPLFNYAELCAQQLGETPAEHSSVLFTRYKQHVLGIVVDHIIGQVELMTKPFHALMPSMPGMRGTAVLADEKVTYILEPEKLVQLLVMKNDVNQKGAA